MHVKSRLRYAIVGGDYKAQEPRILTTMCKDPTLTQTFLEGKDPYATIMSKVRHMDYWDCMEHYQDGTLNPTGKAIRSTAKQLMLGIMYGMGPKLMAQNLGVEIDECKEILEEFFKTFPNIKAFTERNEQMARDLGYVEDYLGRRRHLSDINLPDFNINAHKDVVINNTTLETLDNIIKVHDEDATQEWINTYNEKFKNKGFKKKNEFKKLAEQSNVELRDNGAFISKTLTQCTNATVQGGAASLTKKAMVTIYENKELMKLGFRLLIPVHDELLGECPMEYAEECEKLLIQSMVDAGKPECTVAMGVDTYCVKHWYADEVSGSIKDAHNKNLKGDPKKDIKPISEEESINKLIKKYSELDSNTVKSICNDTFDLMSDKL